MQVGIGIRIREFTGGDNVFVAHAVRLKGALHASLESWPLSAFLWPWKGLWVPAGAGVG